MDDDVIRLDAGRVSWHEFDGEVLAVDLTESDYLSLNPTGAMIWRELAHGTTRPALADVLVRAFAVPADVAAADVEAFLDTLASRGLIEQVEP